MGKTTTAELDTAARPARESVVEIGAFVLITGAVAFLVLWLSAGMDWVRMWPATVQAGGEVLDEIGWVFGVYVPTLLGFYVLVTGEQLGQVSNAAWRRRILGGVAELSFAAIVPALVLVVVYCVSTTGMLGPLFAVIPASGVMFFLTVQLGGFVVFEPSIQLADATQSQARARTQLEALRPRSQRRLWAVLTVNLLAVTLVGGAVLGVTGGWLWLSEWLTLPLLLSWAAATCLFGSFVAGMLAARTVTAQVLAGAGVALVWVFTAGMVLSLGEAVDPAGPLTAALVAITAAVNLSALWPLRRSPRILVDWTLSGGFRAARARLWARSYRDSTRTIRELTDVGSGPGFRTRLGTAWAALTNR
ncbi:hypothetical protein MK786_07320 [Microbacterium sp. CFH 31415]|uniref:hypothetical protein n=1 Tax=Microbacterium sp. CFH 31415 TaxID=2921732 RepID=UPI001F1433F7|nr:hypothetical protein [Microbacterium sp. CFH 31415]MCH6230544.1 hypothetical protein [Microbacterium sp. CFH 31415]